jgi:glycine cleavage system H lipoate-binding protein
MVVLFVVLTIVVFISIDYFIQRRKKVGLAAKVSPSIFSLSKVFSLVPNGVFLQPSFTWSKILDSGNILLGINPVLLGLVGKPDEIELLHTKEAVKKGDTIIKLIKGNKVLSIKSPVTGHITSLNKSIKQNSTWDNISSNWIYCFKNINISEELPNWFIAGRARVWLQEKYNQIKNFFIYTAPRTEVTDMGMMMADGGDIPIGILGQFDKEIWQEFEKNFIE